MKRIAWITVASFLLVGAACSKSKTSTLFQKSDGYTGFQSGGEQSTVVAGDGTFIGSADEAAELPICLPGDVCISGVAKGCAEGEKADIIVVDGKIVDTICYPPPKPENTTEVTTVNGSVEVPQNANNTVVAFDSSTDNTEINGNIVVDGNNVAIYGNGADKTVINGNLEISGNNAVIRGVRVKGNVILTLNNTALLYCVVEGNVVIKDNNITVAATDIFGNLEVEGNNAILVLNRVQGKVAITGQNHFCDGNRAFKDDNGDLLVQSTELTDPIACTPTVP